MKLKVELHCTYARFFAGISEKLDQKDPQASLDFNHTHNLHSHNNVSTLPAFQTKSQP